MKILIAGDFYPRRRVEQMLKKGDYSFFDDVVPIVRESDYSIVNFEGCIASNNDIPIEKTGPNLKCEKEAMEAIKYAGFNCVTLANNHFRDYGDTGVSQTIKECKRYGVDYVGGGENIDKAKKVLYKAINGKSIAIINRCESEWSIATDNQGGSAPLDTIDDYYQIKAAKDKADYVLVITHSGIEEYSYPTPRMKQQYRFYIEAGADAVVNHHQHCISGYEIYREKPIFYGLGNFCFDWVTASVKWWEEGFMVMLDFTSDGIDFVMYPYMQFSAESKVQIIKNKSNFEEEINEINKIIADDTLLINRLSEWCLSRNALSLFEPYNSRLSMGLFVRHLLPSFVGESKKRQILNLVRCESHRESLIIALSQKEEQKL